MPTDLSPNTVQGIMLVRDRAGVGLPFSKGLMATSILATGIGTDVAYRIATDIQSELRDQGQREMSADRLADLAAGTILRTAGAAAADRYRAWRRAKRSGRPRREESVVVVESRTRLPAQEVRRWVRRETDRPNPR